MSRRQKIAVWFIVFPPLLAGTSAIFRQLTPLQRNYYSWKFDVAVLFLIMAYALYRYRISTGNTRR